jgi:hypothetical protein
LAREIVGIESGTGKRTRHQRMLRDYCRSLRRQRSGIFA